jgi:ubiquitin carboxyl-terminal hydrolase 36/42
MTDNKGLVGLNNQGNTCYLNSILQCMLHCKKFVIYLFNHNDSIINSNKNLLLVEFVSLVDKIWFRDNKNISPTSFLSKLVETYPFYRIGQQQDSHECMLNILEELEKNIIELNIIELNIDNQEIEKKEWFSMFTQHNFLKEVFYGLYETEIKCENNHSSITKEPFVDISLPFDKESNLEDLLDNFQKNEYLREDNKYYCEKCKQYVNAEKCLKIKEIPNNNLIIHLKRFDNFIKKKNNLITYPEELTIKDIKYHLFGIVNHTGSLFGGHYYSYIKHIDNNWYELNDSNVSRIDKSVVVNKNAYLLFYQIE